MRFNRLFLCAVLLCHVYAITEQYVKFVAHGDDTGPSVTSVVKQPECRFCHKQFSTVYNARTHERKHTGQQPYRCTLCDRQYHDRSSLRVHMRLHTGIRPFQCRYCQKTFSQLTNLRVHNLRCTELKNVRQETDADVQRELHEQMSINDSNLSVIIQGNYKTSVLVCALEVVLPSFI